MRRDPQHRRKAALNQTVETFGHVD